MECVDVSGLVRSREALMARLLMVVNVDWFFLSHRLPIALGALQAGYDVHVATTLSQGREKLEAYGFKVHALEIDRSGAGPFGLVKLLFGLIHLFWKLKPDVLHLVTIKPVLVGGLAARLSPVKGVVYAVSGLGHVFVAGGVLGTLRRKLARVWYRFILGARNMRIIFQNPDDRLKIESITRLQQDQVVMIPGSGVDLSEYHDMPLPDGVPIVLMAARLLVTKGVREFVAAARRLHASGLEIRFWLVGEPDLSNPASVQPKELEDWEAEGNVEILGFCSEIAELMAKAYVVVLPSYYGEGLPKVLIEAAACGRAVVTTDMPGCRDAIDPGVTGVLVPPKDEVALATEIKRLVGDRSTCKAMGHAGRRRAEAFFNVDAVVKRHLEIYRDIGVGR